MSIIHGLAFRVFPLKNILLGGIIASVISCSFTAEEISTDPAIKLRFSADTIFFDTIFSEIPSISRRLKVYNDYNQTVRIAKIEFNNPNSPYSLTVNGIQGTAFNNTQLLANDSMLVFLEANISDRDSLSPYVVEDQLKFITNGNQQEISVFSWGQDANYLKDSILASNTTWQAGKPYVIFDNILIDSLCTLNIGPGARIFSHPGSNIYVKGSIKVNGTRENRIIFMNDRFDGNYANSPGQWGGIVFLEGSKNNLFQYADIRNGQIGIWLGTPDKDTLADLVLENSIIENMSESAVLAFTADLEMTNCLLDNTGQLTFGGLAGGNYILKHNTIANYAFGFFKSQPAVAITDQLELSDGTNLAAPVSLIMQNNIVWGISNDEISLLNESGNDFTIDMLNNLLKTNDPAFVGFNNITNQDPQFTNPGNFDYLPETSSPAIDAGASLNIFIDLRGNARSNTPDIGAYEIQ